MSRTAKLESLEQRQLLAADVLTLNLENSDDTGVSNVDNVTSGDRFLAPGVMDFFLTADPGSMVVIKDGNTVINNQITKGNTDTRLFLSLQESESLPGGVDVENEDVVAFDGSSFSLFFDGSDVGLAAEKLDALAVIASDEILLSFEDSAVVPGVGTVEDSDIVKFTATQTGENTVGTFSLFFDGSSVGLNSSEGLDAIDLFDNGDLIISTRSNFSVLGAFGDDEDLIRFSPDVANDYSSGTWSMYFDGSDVQIANEDVDAVSLNEDGSIHLHLSSTTSYAFNGTIGDETDAFTFAPTSTGNNTAGNYLSRLLFDGSAFNLDGNDVTGIDRFAETSNVSPIGNPASFDMLDMADGTVDGMAKIRIDFNAVMSAHGIPVEGDHLLTVEADDNGVISQSEELVLTLDLVAPVCTVPELAEPSDTGQQGDNKTNLTRPSIVGIAEPNSVVRVYADGVLVGQTIAHTQGNWEATLAPLVDGTYEITTEVEDQAGNIMPGEGFELTVDATPPQRPGLDLLTSEDSGMSAYDNITNDSPPEILFSLASESEMGTTVVVKNGTEVIFGPVFFSDLNPNDGFARIGLDLDEGTHLLSAESIDMAGNISQQSEELVVVVDRTKPDEATVSLAASSDSGQQGDNKSNKMQPVFVGTTEDNAKIRVYANGILVGQSVATSDGDWEITSEPLVDGTYTITTEAEDVAGNVRHGSGFELEIDTTPPQRPALDLLTREDSGMSAYDNITNDSPPEIRFSLSSESAMGTTVVVKDGTEIIFGPVFFSNLNPSDGFATIGLDLDEGTHLLSAESIDMAGNISHQSEELVVVVDRTAPDATVPMLAPTSDSGVAGDNKTNKMEPAFIGTTESNAKVRVYANGTLVGQSVATSEGDWEITVEPLVDGMYTITTEVEDVAGNITVGDESIVVMIDTIDPQRPTLDLENADDTGMSDMDNVTFGDPNLPTGVMDFFVTSDSGSSIVIKDGNTVINGQVTVGDGDAGPPATTTTTIYMTLNNGAMLPGGVEVENEDVIVFDGTDFSIFFDGSDVGLGGAKIDAVSVLSATEILLSFSTPQLIPGLANVVEDTDIVKFTATQTGDTTDGTFELFFNGNNLGLAPSTDDFEDIDAVELLDDGRLVISTVGPFDVPGLAGEDEDLIAFTPITPGDYSTGTWAMFLDGSDVEISSEDIDAAAVSTDANGEIRISTTNAFNVTGLSGEDEDAFTFVPTQLGDDTAGSYAPTLLFDGSVYGLDSNDLTGLDVVTTTTGGGGGGGTGFAIGTPASFDVLDAADGTVDGIAKIRIDFNAVEATFGIPVEGTHLLSVEAIDVAGNISHQSEELAVTIDRTAPLDGEIAIDLAGTSQTGTLNGSVVTSKMQPAFVGTAEANAKVRVYAVNKGMLTSMPGRVLIGQGVATSQGDWEITVEPLVNGHYTITVDVEDLAGNVTTATDMEMVVVDPQEPNNAVADATDLGSETEVILNDVLLHDESDTDLYKITAHETGKLVIDVGQAAADSFVLTFHDSTGNVLVTDGDAATDPDATVDGKLVVPVVRGETYIIQVANNLPTTDDTKVLYDLEIENFMAPVPTALVLSPADDTGMSNMDNTTFMSSPTMFVQVDLNDFENMGIAIDAAPGADVEVSYAGIITGDTGTVNATRSGAGNIWTATLDGLADDLYFINGRVVITDHAGVQGFKDLSLPTIITVDTAAPAVSAPDLLSSSDTGMSDTDNVTAKMQPAFSGTAEANAKVRVLANGAVVGNGVATAEGDWEVTVEPLDDGVYDITVVAEDKAGNVSDTAAAPLLTIEIDTLEPNTPLLDLVSEDDSGHSDKDNITNVNPATFTMTTTDPNQAMHLFQENYKFRVFNRPEGSVETLIYNSVTDPLLTATNVDGLTAEEFLARELDLSEGVNHLKLEVEDRAGNISHDFLLDVVVDSVTTIDDDVDLIDSSDTGMSNTDNVTNKMQPAFAGLGEANSTVTVYAQEVDATGATIGGRFEVGRGVIGSDVSDGNDGNFGATLSGDQEVPPVDSAGTGDVDLQFDAANNTFSIDVYVEGIALADISAAHIHAASAGVNGSVIVDLTAAGAFVEDGSGVRLTLSDQAFPVDNVADLLNGNTYVNVHTPTNPSGEIRGQLLALGSYEVTVEPLDDGIYDITVAIEDWGGNQDISEPLTIEIDTLEPNTPLLDLVTDDDNGPSDTDNITNADPPTFTMTTTDPNQLLHLIEENYKFRVFDRVEGGVETLIYNSVTDPVLTPTNVDGLTAEEFLERELNLSEGIHNLKLEVEDRAGNISHDFLLNVEIDLTAPVAGDPDMIDSSDTGMSNTDNVTSKMQPAFAGISEVGSDVRIFAEPVDNQGTSLGDVVLIGEGVVGSDQSDANDGDNQGVWEITVEPLDDGIYHITVQIEDTAGNLDTSANPLMIEIDTLEPNTPLLDLASNDDNGVSDTENVTNADMPTFFMTSTDPNQAEHISQFNYKFRVFDRLEGQPEVLIYDSVTDGTIDAANLMDGLTDLDFLARQLDLAEGVHNLKLEVEDRAGNYSHDFLLDVEIDRTPPEAGEVNMIASSDSGMSHTDNITNITQPAFFGQSEVNSTVRVYAEPVDRLGNSLGEPVQIGVGKVGTDESDVQIIPGATNDDDQGVWEVTVEPLDDGIYEISVQLEDPAGNIDPTVNLTEPLTIEIDTLAPNTAFLDLVAASDSGRHDEDNITNDTTPTFTMTTTDPNQADHLEEFNYKFRIYDRVEGGTETLIYNSVLDLPAAGLLDGLTDQEFLQATLNLAEGVHNLKLEVEDRAGNISHDYLLDMVVDITPPDGDLQTLALDPDSDTGVWGFPETMMDLITSDKLPGFVGAAEANALVTITIDGVPAGTAVAVPFDGNDAFPPPPDVVGNYRLQTVINLADGVHTAVATFTDVAGNSVQTNAGDEVIFTVDTQGSRVTAVEINNLGNNYDLFDPKPSTDGPTPPVTSLVISIDNGQLFEPLAESVGNYRLVGDHSGIISIDGQPIYQETGTDTATITLNFFEPLPDDRFTLTLFDELTDAAGNALDGESNADQPQENPIFPSGDGAHGGDFVARFTVDSRPEVATWAQGVVYADINGNFVWDPEGQDNDATNRDFVFNFGEITDAYFTGNFSSGGDASGFDKLGVYGKFTGTYQFVLDTDDDGVADTTGSMAFQVNAIPVAGNFDGNVDNGDEIGAFDGQNWYLDVNGDNNIDSNERFSTSLRGIPVVGDFNGDGNDDLATFNNSSGIFHFDLNRDGSVDDTLTFGFSGFGERPVTGDMNLDGIDDIVLWVPGRVGQVPNNHGEFHFLVSDNTAALPSDIFDRFSPDPLGNDLQAQFGNDFALPLLGNFDPPVASNGSSDSMTNESNPLDTNVDGLVTALDALVIVNALAQQNSESEVVKSRQQMLESMGNYRLDANNDGAVTALDALLVVNGLAEQSAEGESQSWAASADSAIADLDDEDSDDLLDLLALDAEQQRSKS